MSQDTTAQPPVTDSMVIDEELILLSGLPSAAPSPFAIIGAELFGSFLLVFVGLGAGLYASLQGLGSLEIALAFGIALMAGIAAVGKVSGGHFNPAVTFGMALAGRVSWSKVWAYLVGQLVGAVAAAAALFVTIPSALTTGTATLRSVFSATANGFGVHSGAFTAAEAAFYGPYLAQGATREQVDQAIAQAQIGPPPVFPEFSALQVGLIEAICTALFVGVILAVTDQRIKSKVAPIVIGFSLAALLLVATPFSGGSLNPMRSLAAAAFSDSWAISQVWVFWVAPLLGAAVAALFYRGFTQAPDPVSMLAFETDDEFAVAAAAERGTYTQGPESDTVVDFVEVETIIIDVDLAEDETAPTKTESPKAAPKKAAPKKTESGTEPK